MQDRGIFPDSICLTTNCARIVAIPRKTSTGCSMPLTHELAHVLVAQVSGCSPKIAILQPILVLCRSQFGLEQRAAGLAVLIQLKAVFQELPTTVDDLCTRLHQQLSRSTGELVCNYLRILWHQEFFVAALDILFTVNDTIVNYSLASHLIRLRAVRV